MNDETLKRRAEILEAIYRHGMMPTWELAEHLDVTPEDLTANVAALVEQGALTNAHASYLTDTAIAAMDLGVRGRGGSRDQSGAGSRSERDMQRGEVTRWKRGPTRPSSQCACWQRKRQGGKGNEEAATLEVPTAYAPCRCAGHRRICYLLRRQVYFEVVITDDGSSTSP